MKKSLLLWLALMASTSALAEGGKEIRFGVDPTFAPFEWKDPQGKLAGFDIDLGNAICQQLQAKCVWVESNFDGIIPALKARKFDAILSGMYMTEKRKAQIAFSDKLYNGPVFLVARKNTLQGNTPEQLKGKTIGVEQGSAQETYVNQHWRPQGINIVAYQGADSVVRDLESGRIDGAVLSGMMADYSFLQQPQGKEFANEYGQQVNDLVPGWQGAQVLRRTALNGRFCRLEPLDVDRHAADLFAAYALGDNSDWTWLASTRPESVAATAHWIAGKVNDDALVPYAVVNLRSEQAVGIVSYMAIEREMGTVEIGHVTWSRRMKNTPLGTEAVWLLLKNGFDHGYRRLEWKCDSMNVASRRAAERLGFSWEGRLRQRLVRKGRTRDSDMLSIIDGEWPARDAALRAWLAAENFTADGQQIKRLEAFR